MKPRALRQFLNSALFLIVISALYPFSSAQAQGWFAGGSVGVAEQQDYSTSGPVTTRDDSDTGFRVFGGYLISPIQGLVASYVDLGSTYYTGPGFGGFTDDIEADGIDVSWIIGWAPGEQERVAVFGTVGVFAWDQDIDATDASGFFQYHDEGTSFSLGFGAKINLSSSGTSRWAINVEYQLFKDVGDFKDFRIDGVGDYFDHELDREMLSVGVNYRFGSSE